MANCFFFCAVVFNQHTVVHVSSKLIVPLQNTMRGGNLLIVLILKHANAIYLCGFHLKIITVAHHSGGIFRIECAWDLAYSLFTTRHRQCHHKFSTCPTNFFSCQEICLNCDTSIQCVV